MESMRRVLAALWLALPPGLAAQDLPFATATVEQRTVRAERLWSGVVEAVDQATLAAQTGGRVIELPFDVNDTVPEDAVVIRFTDVEQRAAVQRAESEEEAAAAALRQAEADLRRSAELFQRQLVPQSALDQAVATRDTARARLDGARSALGQARQQLEYTVVRAPFSGIVTARLVQMGETVVPGQPLISGLSLDRLRVAVDLPQRDAQAVRRHLEAEIVLDADAGLRLPATEVVMFPYADPSSHTFRVRVGLPAEQPDLYPGMTVKVAFVVGEERRLLVPATALLRRSEVTAVYVVDTSGRVGLRQLRTGHRHGDHVEVLAGLAPGEHIALDPVAAARWVASTRDAR